MGELEYQKFYFWKDHINSTVWNHFDPNPQQIIEYFNGYKGNNINFNSKLNKTKTKNVHKKRSWYDEKNYETTIKLNNSVCIWLGKSLRKK